MKPAGRLPGRSTDGDNEEDQYAYSRENAVFARVTLGYGG